MNKKLLNLADKSAICISMACIVQCLALPVILIALPSISSFGFLSDELFHIWLLFIVIPISSFVVFSSYKNYQNKKVTGLVISGMSFLVLAVAVGHDLLGHDGEVILTVIGSLLLTAGHFVNLRLRKNKPLVNNEKEVETTV